MDRQRLTNKKALLAKSVRSYVPRRKKRAWNIQFFATLSFLATPRIRGKETYDASSPPLRSCRTAFFSIIKKEYVSTILVPNDIYIIVAMVNRFQQQNKEKWNLKNASGNKKAIWHFHKCITSSIKIWACSLANVTSFSSIRYPVANRESLLLSCYIFSN